MAGYEYGNARLRAMRSRLLAKHEIIQLAGVSSLTEMIGLLMKTPYGKSLETALIHANLLDSLFEALRRDFMETAGKIRRFYDGSEQKLVNLILSGYDLHNLKTVLRGLSHHSSRAEIESLLLPSHEITETVLSELLRAGSLREAVDILATLGHRYAQPLLILRAELPGADLFEMETALNRWHFQEASQILIREQETTSQVNAALRMEADLSNLLTVLRFIDAPTEQPILKARLGKRTLDCLFSGPGTVSAEQLNKIYAAKSVKLAVETLAETPYAPALREGLRAYEQSGHLSEIERSLKGYQLRWMAWQIAKDPLGSGVVIGYLALKTNEIANLRRIARGIQLKLSHEAVQSTLEFVE